MNRLTVEKRVAVINCLVEGNSIRATVRMTGVAKATVTKLLEDVGAACLDYQRRMLVKLSSKRLQCDEIWSFVGMKEKNVDPKLRNKDAGIGDVWTWVAIDADTKLVPCFHIGGRNRHHAKMFIDDLASRLANRVQLSTDGHRAYLSAVEDAFGWNGVDYAMIEKIYGNAPEGTHRYSPATYIRSEKKEIMGMPDEKHISTSHAERNNLTMRMGIRRFTRLTNAFSKKIENHRHAVAIHYMHYNFCRIHQSLRVTPAMAAGVDAHCWSIRELVEMADRYTPESN
jgi:IS1 family transposase